MLSYKRLVVSLLFVIMYFGCKKQPAPAQRSINGARFYSGYMRWYHKNVFQIWSVTTTNIDTLAQLIIDTLNDSAIYVSYSKANPSNLSYFVRNAPGVYILRTVDDDKKIYFDVSSKIDSVDTFYYSMSYYYKKDSVVYKYNSQRVGDTLYRHDELFTL